VQASIRESADRDRRRRRSELSLRTGIVIRTGRSLCNDMQSARAMFAVFGAAAHNARDRSGGDRATHCAAGIGT
jgi:hypothetical protein